MGASESLSADEARRIALAAQGFRNARKAPTRDPFSDTLERLHVLQIDSVNVFARSHYLPVLSRRGVYDPQRFDEHLWESGAFTEYWAHEAAFIPVTDRPLFGWRMQDFREKNHRNGTFEQLGSVIEGVRERLRSGGPQFVRDLEDERGRSRGPWWDWSDVKRAVEVLFATGEVVAAGRQGFQRRYALAEHVLPDDAQAHLARDQAQQRLIERAARALGVATAHDLADYHRMRVSEARAAIRTLESEGVLVPVTVEGWTDANGASLDAWLHRDARLPSRLAPDALLTPFDPVVWYRPRAERMFDFHYRIEIYTPKEKRQFGYYCLPLMVGGRLAGRLDLKADRRDRTLRVQAAWREHRAPARTAQAAEELLVEAARWQGLDRVTWSGRGNLPLPAHWRTDETLEG